MIIESLIQDESKLTLDCAKATLHKGSKVDIPDQFWSHPEVQGAIKCGFARLIGPEPINRQYPGMPIIEPEVRFKNVYEYKLAFDCIKKYAAPGDVVYIPVSKIDSVEVREAIGRGWLVNLDNPELTPKPYSGGSPLKVDELSVGDLVEPAAGMPRVRPAPQAMDIDGLPEDLAPRGFPEEGQYKRGGPAQRQVAASNEPIKAKPINRKADDSDGDSYDDNSLYAESKVIDPMAQSMKRAPRPRREMPVDAALSDPRTELAPAPADDGIEMGDAKAPAQSDDDSFGFIDVFQNAQPKKK